MKIPLTIIIIIFFHFVGLYSFGGIGDPRPEGEVLRRILTTVKYYKLEKKKFPKDWDDPDFTLVSDESMQIKESIAMDWGVDISDYYEFVEEDFIITRSEAYQIRFGKTGRVLILGKRPIIRPGSKLKGRYAIWINDDNEADFGWVMEGNVLRMIARASNLAVEDMKSPPVREVLSRKRYLEQLGGRSAIQVWAERKERLGNPPNKIESQGLEKVGVDLQTVQSQSLRETSGSDSTEQKNRSSVVSKWSYIVVGIALLTILVIVLRAAKRKGQNSGNS